MYEKSKIWKRIMIEGAEYQEEKERLRNAFKLAHKNAAILANEIHRDLPDFTIHNIAHLDALWTMTDIFLPDNYPLNPAEVFVLGISFLIHDLGMGLIAYSEGLNSIRNETVWRDTVASLCKQKGKTYNFDAIDSIDNEIQKEATAITLRTLHAHKATNLARMSWSIDSDHIYLIEDHELRAGYSQIIGIIAASHGWDIEKVGDNLSNTIGAISGLPSNWGIDPLKLACIIRIADAMNIDDSRAPKLLHAVRSLNSYSELHWIFQEKLYQPQKIDNRIAYSTKSDFSIDDREAWWLCYDMLQWMDTDIRKVHFLLIEKNRPTFECIGVHSIDSIESLIQRIKVDGWKPIDTRIRATNVANIIHTLGGNFLYGDNLLVPLRELIQNATDAIRARRYVEKLDNNYGIIRITIGTSGNSYPYIEVTDDGIGMSPDTMVGSLLDFGNSFWTTDKMHTEFPGLEQTSFKATGQFGIGFFSTFMWGDKVIVTSNRYDKGRKDTTVLEFVSGIKKRPFLRKATPQEYINNGGTSIRIYLSEYTLDKIFASGNLLDPINKRVETCLIHMCPCLDCQLDLQIDTEVTHLIRANDWITMDSASFLKRLYGEGNSTFYPSFYEYITNNLQHIYDGEQCIGRACILPGPTYNSIIQTSVVYKCIVTVGGLFSSTLQSGIIGCLVGNTTRASRDNARPIISNQTLDNWVQQQAHLLSQSDLSVKNQNAKAICMLTNINTEIKITLTRNGFLNYKEIVDKVQKSKETRYLIYPHRSYGEEILRSSQEIYDNVFLCDTEGISYQNGNWPCLPEDPEDLMRRYYMYTRVFDAIAEGWGVTATLRKAPLLTENTQIGINKLGNPIMVRAYIISKP